MSRLTMGTAVLLTALAAASGQVAAQSLSPQTSNQNAVTVKATPKALPGDRWEFELVYDTHSQELKDDVASSAALVGTDGALIAPVAWQGDPPSGHHRKGVLRFNAVKPQPDVLELRITRAGETAPRTFKWKVK
ncbi:MAG TPA: hypothetical protein VGE12_21380 [Noviherbaspirillum sp.]